ncbi:hypothetical protein TNCV_1626351 [Trichonephila clavipes]|nr:hypothetical protein TNCV_1626351 [Trichonephila clavipes]
MNIMGLDLAHADQEIGIRQECGCVQVQRTLWLARWHHDSSESCVFLLQSRVTNVGIDSNRAPSIPNASTSSITPKRSSSDDV